ncbi:MAG: insulinase family protein [Acidobacteria bacterium]|nr:insulinase family protein [Acidobacteriota bacterium]
MKGTVKETRFENGLVVLTDRMSEVRSATLGFFFRSGSRHEPDELNGITHFIEHCVFKGTERRSAMDIAMEQDRLGGNLDAFTTHEETGFLIKVIDDRFEAAFDLLSDMLFHPRFDKADLESEQRVIIEEIKMTEDSPEELLGEIFHREFFRGHPLGLSIAGTPETVRSFDAETTRRYHAQAFDISRLVVAAAGNVDHERLVELCEALSINGSVGQLAVPSAPQYSAPIHIEQKRGLEQAHLMLATPFVAAPDDRRYAADLLANIIGGGTSSRLWQKVREERGLAYSVGASAIMFQDAGVFSVFAGTSPEATREVIDIVLDEMRAVVSNGVTADELQLAKDQSVAAILLGLEDTASRAASLANYELIHGRHIPVVETLANIDAVAADDLQRLAAIYFTPENLAFVALGDLKNLARDKSSFTL